CIWAAEAPERGGERQRLIRALWSTSGRCGDHALPSFCPVNDACKRAMADGGAFDDALPGCLGASPPLLSRLHSRGRPERYRGGPGRTRGATSVYYRLGTAHLSLVLRRPDPKGVWRFRMVPL